MVCAHLVHNRSRIQGHAKKNLELLEFFFFRNTDICFSGCLHYYCIKLNKVDCI